MKKRIHAIDEVRGLCIILVVFYHLFYTGAEIFHIQWFESMLPFLRSCQPVLPIAFIFISGLAFNLSRNNEKRGMELMWISITITLVTAIFMPSQVIWFGILHFLAVANLFCGYSKKTLDKIPFILGLILSVILFIATYHVTEGYLGIGKFSVEIPPVFFDTDAFMMFGVYSPDFYSADYVSILPWIFLFTSGLFLGRHIHKLPKFIKERHLRPLAFVGRHTLIIYIIHQPVIFGIFYLLTILNIV